MKEIKFRVWNKESQSMCEEESIASWVHTARNNGIAEGMVGIKQSPSDERESCLNHLEVMQFTGLLDKQSKEIYEGDIVRVWDYGFKDGNEDGDFGLYQDMGLDRVTMDRFPRYWLDNEAFGYEGEDLIDPEHCEVIGNIYENPLEKK